jgi:hypothetical protein
VHLYTAVRALVRGLWDLKSLSLKGAGCGEWTLSRGLAFTSLRQSRGHWSPIHPPIIFHTILLTILSGGGNVRILQLNQNNIVPKALLRVLGVVVIPLFRQLRPFPHILLYSRILYYTSQVFEVAYNASLRRTHYIGLQ